ncbi:zonular occludens toxin domain-containing protein [Xanthomonas citri]|uniref:zonular occludens toxin domain-containing protein n=1 Tax=Xanthomonas citri TaxID=346 RepID=UPI001F3D6D01|nr:zonular occludens toxin domain-containing protein [Xanthomonas citri]
MIYWFTGQPGHGKTLHAIEKLLEYKDQGRMVFACNIREFDYEKTGVLEMTPEQFRDWPNFMPDGAVALVDEAYEHGMLPKRPPGSKVPHHVEQLAKHRHRGLDFIFVSQSPDKQCDQFVHDLIERHVHVRRRFGTKFVHLRELIVLSQGRKKRTLSSSGARSCPRVPWAPTSPPS